MSILIGAIPLIAVAAAPCVLWLAGRSKLHPGWISAAVLGALLAALGRLAPLVLAGETITLSLPWFPAFGLRYALVLDGLGLLFALLITGAGVLIFIYSAEYMPREPQLGRFYAHLLLFAGAMLGVVLADDLIVLYISWELTSLASFFLIGYHDDDPAARAGATQALVVTVAGGVVMLAGVVLLALAGGSWQISSLIANAATIKADSRYLAIVLLILSGAFAKSAQIPVQFWLPGAMVAPTPVSTYLHSATMVWAGVYLLSRLLPVLGGTPLWTSIITPVGLGTLLLGAGLAVTQADLKALLAYSTIGALGLCTALVGWGTPAAAAAAMVYMLNHGAFKASLFLVAGAVEHETGTRQISSLGGLWKAMPITAVVAGMAGLSMAALPPFGGFLGKEAAVEALMSGSWLAGGVVILSGLFTVAYGVRFMTIFFGESPRLSRPRGKKHGHALQGKSPGEAHEPPLLLWMPPAVMAALALLLGVFPGIIERLAGLAASAMTGAPHTVHLWHGFTMKAAVVTTAALVGGAALFSVRARIIRTAGAAAWLSAGRAYEWLYTGTLQAAKAFTGLYMTGRLRDYLVLIMITTLAGLAYGLTRTGLPVGLSLADLDPGEAISILVAIAASVAAVRLHLLLGAILALGVAGYSVSLVYLLLSAPDIAVTQVVIETISIVLFLVALTALGKTQGDGRGRQPLGDGLIAAATGGVAVALALMVADIADVPRIAESFFANAAKAGGTNVVNLVIIDFRGWDTLGEISVLGIAALGIMAMAPWRSRAAPDSRTNTREYPAMTSLILRTVTALVAPIVIVFALRLWWTGHYGPGGGFVGGLMVAAALSLLALEGGAVALVRRWDWLMALGLTLAVGSAIVPMLFGYSPLQHTVVHEPIKLASSLIFDLGVLLLVTGTVMAAIRSLVEAT